MANPQEVQVQEKRELEKKKERTVPGRVFVAVADIFETDQALTGLAKSALNPKPKWLNGRNRRAERSKAKSCERMLDFSFSPSAN